jgi:phospholipid/cholesterol/gamma-HCH transport system substrate-binding protein
MKRSAIETIVGLIVIIIAFSFVFFTYKSGILTSFDGEEYIIKAEFEKADGVEVGSAVKMSGVKVGFVSRVGLNFSNYNAEVEMKIKSTVMLPVDTSAAISGIGLIGDKYISLTPGADTQYLANGGSIDFTQSSVSIESLIGKFMFGAATDGSSEKPKDVHEDDAMVDNEHEIEPQSHESYKDQNYSHEDQPERQEQHQEHQENDIKK